MMLKDEQLEDQLNLGETARLDFEPSSVRVRFGVPASRLGRSEAQPPVALERAVVERAPQEEPRQAPVADEEPARQSFLRRRPFGSALGALLVAAAVGGGSIWWDYASHFESTDDAFIASRQIALAPKISGYVNAVPVTDNQHVAAGAVIASIDDRDYRVALDLANAQVAAAKASLENIDAQTHVQRAQIESAQAQADQARAALVFAQQQAGRYEQLARTGAGSVQNAQQYNSQLDQQQAALKSAQAAVVVAQRQIESLKAQRDSAQASLAQANAQRDQAQLNLSYTKVVAAEPGRVVNLTAEPGEFAQAGTNLTMFVPDETWVTANFKENQLDAMRPGQPVTLSIDAYPERDVHGRVASVQPGSGTAFSLLPAQNATGNYVKIVQRVPVKIVMDNPPADVALGPGMSVVPSVRVNAGPTLYEKLSAAFDRLWRRA
jgi:membrane fusion protein (multidrug efflux system)